MSEQLKVLIVGGTSLYFGGMRCGVIKLAPQVNVGTIGHINHGRAQVYEPTPTLSDLTPVLIPIDKVKRGKGQRKANKKNRWK